MRFIAPAHQGHKSFLKPSQLPGELRVIAAVLAHTWLIKPILPSQIPILLLGGEKQLW